MFGEFTEIGGLTSAKNPAEYIEVRCIVDGKLQSTLADPGTSIQIIGPAETRPYTSFVHEGYRCGLSIEPRVTRAAT